MKGEDISESKILTQGRADACVATRILKPRHVESCEQTEIEQPLELERILACFFVDPGGRLMCRAE